jgi:polyisoprenyl-phosphate glycosyltransferase
MTLISLVVPVYNNAASVADLLARFGQLAARQAELDFEFVFVDDGSSDDSFAVLRRLADGEPRLCVVKLSRNFGSNAAILAGMEQARGEAVVAIAADLQDPPELIDEMLARWQSGRKVVLAAREGRDDPWLTTLLADSFYSLFRRYAIKTMPRHGFDFFLVDRQVADLVIGIRENNAYLMGLILWLGFDTDIVTYHRQKREKRYGNSMWTLARKLKYFADAFVGFSYMPLRAASGLGVISCLVGFVYALYIVASRLFRGTDIQGWASLMVVLLFVSGVQLMMMGVLGEYLWRSSENTRRRPPYVRQCVIGDRARKEKEIAN